MRSRRITTWVAGLCVVTLLGAHDVPAQGSPRPVESAVTDSSVAHTLRLLTETGHHPYLTWPDYPNYRDELEELYEPGGYDLLWFENGKATNQGGEVVEALLEASTHGLDPGDYDAEAIAEHVAALTRDRDPDGSKLALVDAALSVGFLRYLSDLHIGRVNPKNLSFGFNIEDKKLDLAAVVKTAIERDEINETLARVEPGFPQYERMRQVLAEYRDLAGRDLPRVPEAATVHPGDEYAGTAELQALLVAIGDLAPGSPAAGSTYDGALVEGVEHFQARHGLDVDGTIGKATFAELNTPIADRVHQIELALERLRWLPDVLDEPVAVVNVPAFELWALDPSRPGDRIALEMRVVVGKAVSKQTPAFQGNMRYVVMSPYWNVPYSIAVNELLPAIKQDPGYLDSHNMEIVPDFSWEAQARPATPENLDAVRAGRLNIRQRPGGRNSLGPAKFIFPNAEAIYFHGTPAHQLFERTRRDFSHGCIRLENPLGMADWVLRDQEEWTSERIEETMHAGSPTRVNLSSPLPVIIFYTTVMADEEQPHFYDDIYGHDDALEAALQMGYPYPP